MIGETHDFMVVAHVDRDNDVVYGKWETLKMSAAMPQMYQIISERTICWKEESCTCVNMNDGNVMWVAI